MRPLRPAPAANRAGPREFAHLGASRRSSASKQGTNSKALNKGATYWVCAICAKELRARGGRESKAVWDCPTAAKSDKDGCKCCADAKKQQVGGGKRPKSKVYTSSKTQKANKRRKSELQEGDQ